MILTSATETDLLLPLFEGMRENPRFSTFLDRLRRRTDARYVALLIREGENGDSPLREFFAGPDLRRLARENAIPNLFELDRAHYDSLRPGRVYTIAELVDHDPLARTRRRQQMAALGLADERIVRALAGRDLNVWIVLARAQPCSASDSALLSSLAPYVSEAVRTAYELEREKRTAQINATGLARSGNGWMAFDQDARLGAIAADAAIWWEEQSGIAPRIGERLLGLPRRAERTLFEQAQAMANDPRLPPHPILLCEAPRTEALLSALPDALRGERQGSGQGSGAEPQALVMLAVFALPHKAPEDALERMRTIHELPRREAELALLLAQGLTIAEAGSRMGLTIETARNYSKRIYAKLGVRGKAELVRLVLQGAAGMA